jgi:hypothetical protein
MYEMTHTGKDERRAIPQCWYLQESGGVVICNAMVLSHGGDSITAKADCKIDVTER